MAKQTNGKSHASKNIQSIDIKNKSMQNHLTEKKKF